MPTATLVFMVLSIDKVYYVCILADLRLFQLVSSCLLQAREGTTRHLVLRRCGKAQKDDRAHRLPDGLKNRDNTHNRS